MPEVKWIKIVTDFFDDEKIQLIEAMPDADTILIIWIKLLTLAGKKNLNGYILLTENIPYTDEMLATIFNRPVNTVRLALEVFKKYEMINYNGDGTIQITKWEKHQNIEGLERIREQTKLRVRKFRKNKKMITDSDCNATSNGCNAVDKIRIDKNRLDKKKKERDKYVKLIFEHWKKVMKHPGAKLSKERSTKIKARLKEGYSYKQCIAAINGCASSPYHMGKNNDGTIYDSIELIFRNASKIESFIERNKSRRRLVTSISGKAKTDDYNWEVSNEEK